jgi:Cd2+/Zn2+-exporting ATPase
MGPNGNEPASKIHLNVLLSGVFWVVALLGAIPGWHNLEYAGLLSVLFGIPPVASKAWKTVRRRQFDANCMMVIAAFGALALQEYDEAASVAFLFAISEWLEARATAKARRALGAIVSLRPDHANVLHPVTKTITITAASRVPVGSLVSVRTGDKVPADGIVVEGTTTIDESSLTGEARPATKRVDDTVSGGSINIGQTQLVVMTTSTVDDSAVSRLIRLVEEAQANRSPTEKMVDNFARTYTPVVMIMATFMCTIPWLWGSETGRYWSLNGLIIIVLACPCALTVSSPITYSAGLAATAQRGIIIKGGVHLEALGNVKKIVFDKTGTLTQGKFALNHLDTIGTARTRTQLLELLSVMEAPSSHPLSATLVQAAKKEGIEPSSMDASVTNHTLLKGEGVTARVNHEVIYVGNPRLFRRVGMYDDLPEQHKQAAEEWSQAGGTVGFLGIEGVGIIGAFCVSDVVREEARDVVHALQAGGMEVMMLTGDGEGAAKAVGLQVGLSMDAIHSGLLPEDKLHFIGSLKGTTSSKSPLSSKSSVAQGMLGPCFSRKELVLMCGDGVNDAPALAVSDVGVAMGEGAALSMEMSDVTLMDSNLTKLLFSIKMGSKVILTIQENIIFSLFAKIIVVGLTFWGKMTLLTAIASDVGVMLAVTLNGMKLLPSRQMASLQEEVYIKDEERQRRRAKSKYHELPLAGSRQPNEMEEIL